jgi:predicted RNA-binding protein with PUA-like domain
MAYWLMKSEPGEWSWEDQLKENPAEWDGVRNYQASNNMKAMKIGDLAFFYHSGKDRQIVGVVKIVKEYYPDHTDLSGRFGMVDVETVKPLQTPVSITEIKARSEFTEFLLVRNSRLSVMPVAPNHWRLICEMGGIEP